MKTVSNVANKATQPHGGYINPKEFKIIEHTDGKELSFNENIGAQVIGLTADYLIRFVTFKDRNIKTINNINFLYKEL